MTISTSNVEFSEIQTEFGGSNPITFSEYYRGGSYVTSHAGTATIPTSGTIKVSDFFGTYASNRNNNALTLTSDVADFNLYNHLVGLYGSSYFNMPADITITIDSGVHVYSTNTSNAGFDTGAGWPATSTVTIINNGYIIGKGGAGGAGASLISVFDYNGQSGSAGGPALNLTLDVSITNANGYIYGGGGGGGGGSSQATYYYIYEWASGGGGGGGGQSFDPTSGGTGGLSLSNYYYPPEDPWRPASLPNRYFYVNYSYDNPASPPGNAGPGTSGTFSGAGTGGTEASNYFYDDNDPINYPTPNYITGGDGGNGGTWGTAGSAGVSTPLYFSETGGAAGAGGKSINLNGFVATFVSGNDSTHVKGLQA